MPLLNKFKNVKIILIMMLLLGWSLLDSKEIVMAVPNNVAKKQQTKNTDTAIFREIIDRKRDAYARGDYETAFTLQSKGVRHQTIAPIVFFAYLRAPDLKYEAQTEALKAKVAQIEKATGVSLDNIGDASPKVQAQYVKAAIDSLKPKFPQLDVSEKLQKIKDIDYELEMLSQTDSTAVVLSRVKGANLSQENKDGKVLEFIKQDGQWISATRKELEIARTSHDSLHYVSPGLLPLLEAVPYLANKKPIESSAEWYKTLPSITAEEKGIEVGDAVLGYVETTEKVKVTKTKYQERKRTGLRNFRVISIVKTNNGDRATVANHKSKVFSNIPLAVLYKVEDLINKEKPLQIGDMVLRIHSRGYSSAKISRIEGSQFYAKYQGWDEIEEDLVKGTVIPLPRDGYLLRRIVYLQDKEFKEGIVIAETDSRVWLESYERDTGVINLAKKDVRLIEQADSNLRYRPVWTIDPWGELKQVKTIRVIEPGLLYEIDEKESFEDKYEQLSFDEILLSKPSFN